MPILHEDENQLNVKKSANPIKDIFRYVLITGTIWLAYELSKDYCFEQGKRLTDKEYLSIVLDDLLKSGDMKNRSWDNTVDTYLSHHPECCRVTRNSKYLDVYLFVDEVLVEITYEMSDRNRKGNSALDNHKHYQSLTVMSTCGEPMHRTGEATTAPNNEVHSTK